MKKIRGLFAVTVMSLLLVACAAAAHGAGLPVVGAQLPESPSSEQPPQSVTVVGTGKVSLVPDIVRIRLSAHLGSVVRPGHMKLLKTQPGVSEPPTAEESP